MSQRFSPGLRMAALCAAGLMSSLIAATLAQAANGSRAAVVEAAPAATRAVVLEGELQVEVADFTDRSSVTYHFLKTPTGQRHPVKLKAGRPERLVSGTRVRIKGQLADNNVLTAEASPTPVGTAPTDGGAALPYAIGTQKTAVILVNFQDKVTSPQTPDAVRSLVFGQVSNFFLENSFQTTPISGSVFGWYTIPVSSTTCDITAIKNNARQAATSAGVDLTPYSRFVYIFPNTSACSWAGYGMIGGSPTDAWINGYFDRRIIAHELGHNLGLYHAHSRDCGAYAIGGTCTASEYGDLVDTMGWGLYGHFSAYQKEALGWLNYSGMPPITTVQSSGSYEIAPYVGATGTQPKALKILKGTDATTGTKTWYYLEYRQPTGFDSGLAGTGNLTTGVSVRVGDSAGIYLLDMTPASDLTSEYNDLKDSALTVGRTFTDSTAGVSFTVTRADTTGATVNVTLQGTTTTSCVRAKPSVAVSPAQTGTVAAGTAVDYNVAIANNDSSACGSSSFNLGKTLPSGWTGTLATSSVTLGAGGAASTTLRVTSPTTALGGSYSVGVSATSATTNLAGSGTATYSVSGTSNVLSEAVAVQQGIYTRGSTATTIATVKNNGVLLANASVTFKLTKSNGDMLYYTTTTDSNGQAVFRYQITLTDPLGYYRSGATASYNGLSAYTSASFQVQ